MRRLLKAGAASNGRLFVVYGAISVVPVLALGLVLAYSLRSEAREHGLAQGRSEAALVGETGVEPLLEDRPLSLGIGARERAGLKRLVARAVGQHEVLRLRVRDLRGQVVFSDDGSGFGEAPESVALDAAGGSTVARLTHLNADSNDHGRAGAATVEVYLPLHAGVPARTVGVLELYLPYAPIGRDIAAGMAGLYRDLAIGLAGLYLALFAITWSVSRGLRREVARNAFLAEHDVLTELPNRTLFHRRAKAALVDAVRHRRPVAIAIVDLDRFKDINDTLGHHNGDLLLSELASRVAANMRGHDTVARLGGDEFGLILRDAAAAEGALWRLREIINGEVEVSGLPLSVEASIGFVVAPEDGGDVDTLLQRADVAMYCAKAQHAGIVRYEGSLDHYDAEKLTLVGELRNAIDSGQMVLHYQPQTALADGRINAVEALIRWQHPTHGLLYPDRFLPLAEQTDVIDKLTDWVVRTALRELHGLGAVAEDLAVAVNVSARSVVRPDLAAQVVGALAEVGLPAERLIIEVTETALLVDRERAANTLSELAAAGVKVSLDDFGRGQTSLGYLSALPIDELKIDKSFVLDMLEAPAHAAIVRSIVELGHNLDLRVVGEGVESEAALAALGALGCDVAQGYLLGRPMDALHLAAWLPRPTVPAPLA
ncbi:MAG TPA: bifunctional diguanylate cyclase/phosphodiesterase [Solirubrobacteraceae bacterium]|jgi:diguanylate cyclase (GGDEF)-like protein